MQASIDHQGHLHAYFPYMQAFLVELEVLLVVAAAVAVAAVKGVEEEADRNMETFHMGSALSRDWQDKDLPVRTD